MPPPGDSVELVITVPLPFGEEFAYEAGTRTTLGVLVQLIVEAKYHLVFAAPYLQQGYGLSDPRLSESLRVALQRGVHVDIVSTRRGLATLDLSELRVGPRGALHLFVPRANALRDDVLGSHAKFCLADNNAVYLGSANYTGPALNGQLELGVLVRGSVARRVQQFWVLCRRNQVFVPLSHLDEICALGATMPP